VEVLEMFKFLEKWALSRLLKRLAKQKFNNPDIVKQVWEEHHTEIEHKIAEAIKKIIVTIVQREVNKRN
jgi:hypothetical protein